MKLTGKALNAFKSWYEVKYGKHYSWSIFKDIPESMQFGVYQDWADSMGYDMITEASIEQDKYWYTIYNQSIDTYNDTMYKTRQEARNAAIEKLNEIINKQ